MCVLGAGIFYCRIFNLCEVGYVEFLVLLKVYHFPCLLLWNGKRDEMREMRSLV